MFHSLEIISNQRLTPDSVAISFAVPETLKAAFAFTPGQYLTLREQINGEEVRRSYSIASEPGQPLTVGIKRVEGGTFSTFAQNLEAGNTLDVMPPEGRFVLDDAQHRLLLVAAGSGITPMVSIAATALERGSDVALVFGNQSTETIMFRQTIENLKDRYMDRFTLVHILSREAQDVEMFHGHITPERLQILTKGAIIAPHTADGIFLCGPSAMVSDLRDSFTANGIDSHKIHTELFFEGTQPAPAPLSKAARDAAADGVTVTVLLDGTTRAFPYTNNDATVLDAAHRAGLELPFSCKGGMCCTCRCKIAEGQAEMAVNYSLEPWETKAGFTLACQTRPTSSKLTLDFDTA